MCWSRGVRLFSDFKGDKLLKRPNGSSGKLPDFLFVKSLGVILLSTGKFCHTNNVEGISDAKNDLISW